MADEDNGISELRSAVKELHNAVSFVRDQRGVWRIPESSGLPTEATSWNFVTFEKFLSQRFSDLKEQLRERYEAQQTGVTAALAAAEKAVNAALIAAEKAVDKAEGAQQLRNEAQNEFRKSLSDLSGLMWTTKEGTAAVDALRREVTLTISSLDERVGKTETVLSGKVGDERINKIEVVLTGKASDERVNKLESANANIQGRIWGVAALFWVIGIVITVVIEFVRH